VNQKIISSSCKICDTTQHNYIVVC